MIKALEFKIKSIPINVFFTFFEVDLSEVINNLIQKVEKIREIILMRQQQIYLDTSQAISNRYSEVVKFIARSNRSARELVEMEAYKNSFIIEMSVLSEKMYNNRKIFAFLMDCDHRFNPDGIKIIKDLYDWPKKVEAAMFESDERTRIERADLEEKLKKQKSTFEAISEAKILGIEPINSFGEIRL